MKLVKLRYLLALVGIEIERVFFSPSLTRVKSHPSALTTNNDNNFSFLKEFFFQYMAHKVDEPLFSTNN